MNLGYIIQTTANDVALQASNYKAADDVSRICRLNRFYGISRTLSEVESEVQRRGGDAVLASLVRQHGPEPTPSEFQRHLSQSYDAMQYRYVTNEQMRDEQQVLAEHLEPVLESLESSSNGDDPVYTKAEILQCEYDLMKFYTEHNPGKSLAEVRDIVGRYSHNENGFDTLWRQMRKRYASGKPQEASRDEVPLVLPMRKRLELEVVEAKWKARLQRFYGACGVEKDATSIASILDHYRPPQGKGFEYMWKRVTAKYNAESTTPNMSFAIRSSSSCRSSSPSRTASALREKDSFQEISRSVVMTALFLLHGLVVTHDSAALGAAFCKDLMNNCADLKQYRVSFVKASLPNCLEISIEVTVKIRRSRLDVLKLSKTQTSLPEETAAYEGVSSTIVDTVSCGRFVTMHTRQFVLTHGLCSPTAVGSVFVSGAEVSSQYHRTSTAGFLRPSCNTVASRKQRGEEDSAPHVPTTETATRRTSFFDGLWDGVVVDSEEVRKKTTRSREHLHRTPQHQMLAPATVAGKPPRTVVYTE